jgi:hypothetical protein
MEKLKQPYTEPVIETTDLDQQISLILNSLPPEGPEEGGIYGDNLSKQEENPIDKA